MPYRLQYIPSKKCYSVRSLKKGKGNKKTVKKIHSKCTSKKNAQKQIRLLRAIKYNPNFTRKIRK